MKKLLFVVLGMAMVMLLSTPPAAQAQVNDAIALTAQAWTDLTDWPANGKRNTVDITKVAGADYGVNKKAAVTLTDALAKARSGNANARAIMKLEEAIYACKAGMHKECRLFSEGALAALCQTGSGDACSKAPKYGSYVAP
jgi:hypothetical protein